MSVATYTNSGTKAVTAAKLDKSVFGVAVSSHDLLKQAYLAYQANARVNLSRTKTRGLVSGGGKKPWKQKGTGRARFGSSRNPIWRGGGIAFGPTGSENYSKKLNTTAKRLAIRQALSVAADSDKVIVVENLEFKKGKTSQAVKFFEKIGLTKRTLLVVENKTPELVRATQNIRDVKLVQANYVNVFDALNADHIVITVQALKLINEWLGAAS